MSARIGPNFSALRRTHNGYGRPGARWRHLAAGMQVSLSEARLKCGWWVVAKPWIQACFDGFGNSGVKFVRPVFPAHDSERKLKLESVAVANVGYRKLKVARRRTTAPVDVGYFLAKYVLRMQGRRHHRKWVVHSPHFQKLGVQVGSTGGTHLLKWQKQISGLFQYFSALQNTNTRKSLFHCHLSSANVRQQKNYRYQTKYKNGAIDD